MKKYYLFPHFIFLLVVSITMLIGYFFNIQSIAFLAGSVIGVISDYHFTLPIALIALMPRNYRELWFSIFVSTVLITIYQFSVLTIIWPDHLKGIFLFFISTIFIQHLINMISIGILRIFFHLKNNLS